MKPIVISILLLFLVPITAFGQIKIGDNPENIDPSSVLELESTSRVFVITRVSNVEMEAITPQRGGMVYNTDTQCVHYFNGAAWINLCEGQGITLTNDPIINTTRTISIVENGTTINLEVAQNSIRSENIVDGGINGVDIQENSIGVRQLGEDAVGASELRDNSVGTFEIIDGSITPRDMANTIANQVLTTDANGIVNWVDASDVSGVVTDVTTITGTGIAGDVLAISDAVQNAISVNALDIAEHIGTDMDTDDRNELLTSAVLAGNELVITEAGIETRVDLEPLNNTGTDNQTLDLTGNTLSISGGNDVDLSDYLDNTDAQELEINGNIISISGGNDITLPAGTVDTDDQNLTLAGTTLNITDGVGVDLNPILLAAADGVITNMELTGTDLVVTGTAPGFNGTIPLGTLGGGTDAQQLTLEAGNQLTLTNDATPIDLTPFLDNQNAAEVPVAANPTNYAIGAGNVEAHLTGIDAALANTITQNLTSVLTIGSSAGNLQINDVADPTLPQDAATKNYVDASVVASGGGVPTDELITNFALNTTILTITEDGVDFTVDLDPTFVTEAELTALSINDADFDPNNELQDIQLAGTIVSLTSPATAGNSIDLDLTFVTEAELAAFSINDGDFDSTNELQDYLTTDGLNQPITNNSGGNPDNHSSCRYKQRNRRRTRQDTSLTDGRTPTLILTAIATQIS